MRKIISNGFLSFFILLCAQASFSYGVHEKDPYHFSISKSVYSFSEIYHINPQQKETYPGTVKKSVFRVRTNYDLSDAGGWQATGVTRIVSMGALYPWATDIDVYDTRGVQIGFIDGDFATLELAKFNLYEYDEVGNSSLVGIAYATRDFNQFIIHPSINDPRAIAEFHRNAAHHSWDVTVYNPDMIDDRLIRIFAAFVIDYQNKFLSAPDDEEIE